MCFIQHIPTFRHGPLSEMIRGGGGGEALGSIFAGYVPLAFQTAPTPFYSILWPIIDRKGPLLINEI